MKLVASVPCSYDLWPTPVGWLGLVADHGLVLEIVYRPEQEEVRSIIRRAYPQAQADPEATAVARQQIEEYFQGKRRQFDLPLDWNRLPPFAVAILRQLVEVPSGETVTYGELAALAGHPRAARAVGRVMATNPFPLVVPCHRVVGAGLRLTGYSGGEGLTTKAWLLRFEGVAEAHLRIPGEKKSAAKI